MPKKIKIDDNHFVPIISDGAIATSDAGDGRAIPVLVLDCENHKDLLNLIYLHENSPPGDVDCTWGANKAYAFLLLRFNKPSEVDVGIKFDLSRQANLADGIVQSRGVYLQPRESGTRVSCGLDNPKILIEVPPLTKLDDWDQRLHDSIVKSMRREGLSRKQAKLASVEALMRSREFWGFRMD
ncbi:MAG: hypothetical protein ACI88H_001145 [Cocleimonas sp.]|jgi:hypothetical protein